MASDGDSNVNAAPKPSMYLLQDTEEIRRVFSRFDANGDGKISARELVDVMKALGSETTAKDVSRMMEEIDTDQDGFINLDEFASFCKGGAGDSTAPVGGGGGDAGGLQQLKDAFELYDEDKNGLISAAELHRVLICIGEKCSVHDCIHMIKSVDSDGDGSVSFEEFKKMMSNKGFGFKGDFR
ncbi:hypothetical protein NMG60_11024132 [Bertholletia excelsa]